MTDLEYSQSKSYNQILKTTAIFGGVKIFSVLIGLFKAKIIAIFLGPAGMGVFNLINYPVTLFSQFSGLGISTSGIREVAQTKDEQQLSETAEVIKYWNRTLGVIGSLILLALAPWISRLSFGDDSYTWAFQILSVVVFLTNLGGEYEVLLRGRRETKLVAKAGFYSSLAGFIVSIPFYYAFGIPGIVVVIFITAMTLAGVNYLYARKLKIRPTKLPYREIFKRGKNMVSIGFFIVLGDLLFVGIISVVNAFIRNRGGIEDVGYFQACFQIAQSSINVVLVAMAADYYPKLSKLHDNICGLSTAVTQQLEIAVCLCVPIVVCLIVFSPLVIQILLSPDFLCVQYAISLFLSGAIFRLPYWALNFVVLAKADTKLYVTIVAISNICILFPTFCLGYYAWGIEGIAYAYICLIIVNGLIEYLIVRRKYGIKLASSFMRIYMIGCLIVAAALVSSNIQSNMANVLFGGVVLVVSCIYSIKILNTKVDIIAKIRNKFHY